jgi:tRNA dimethylallyltransferase
MSSSADSADAESVPTIPVICGPTASGKSDLAMWLAGRHPVEIISADSRQIYRHFDVGTAKPSLAERERVPHHGIDVAEPAARYSAADWSAMAQRAIRDALGRQRMPVVVGGTGFYIAALFKPLWEQPTLDPEQRLAVQNQLDRFSLEELRRWCGALDPARAHFGRAQLLRAIEVALLTGQKLSGMHVSRARPGLWQPRYLLVDPGTELQARIAARASAMLERGWLDEVRRLMAEVPDDAPAWNATGYELARDHVAGRRSREEMLERIVIDTRQYAKRQRTWFRHQLEADRVTRVSPTASGWQETVERWMLTA